MCEQMSRKVEIFLFVILMINTVRYTTYLVTGSSSVYYIIMLIVHVIALLLIIIYGIYKTKVNSTGHKQAHL